MLPLSGSLNVFAILGNEIPSTQEQYLKETVSLNEGPRTLTCTEPGVLETLQILKLRICRLFITSPVTEIKNKISCQHKHNLFVNIIVENV